VRASRGGRSSRWYGYSGAGDGQDSRDSDSVADVISALRRVICYRAYNCK